MVSLKSFQFTLVLSLLLTTGCATVNKSQDELVILAASSLTNAFEELTSAFEKLYPNTNIILSFGSSSQLAAQIIEGVNGDIFASANEYQMEVVNLAGEIQTHPVIFTTNTLVIAVPIENPYEIQNLEDLTQSNIRLVLAVENTPIREYSDKLIEDNLSPIAQDALYSNLASEEANVRQVVTKVALGEADAALVYSSDITPENSAFLIGVPIAEEHQIYAQYPITILKRTQNQNLAEEFIRFILSNEGQAILRNLGFGAIP